MTFSAAAIVRSANSLRSSAIAASRSSWISLRARSSIASCCCCACGAALFLEALGHLLRLRDDRPGLRAALRRSAACRLAARLSRLLLAAFGRAQAFLDALPALVQHLQDRLVDEQAQHDQQER